MPTLSEVLSSAHHHHRTGNLPQAEMLCRYVLQHDPARAVALHLLGMIAYQVGKHGTAIDYISRAIASNPTVASFRSNLGLVLLAQGQLATAVTSFREALRLQPDFAEAHNNLGNALQAQGEITAAVASYHAALRAKPHFAKAHYNLGNALQAQGEITAAVASYEHALHLQPHFAQASYNLGHALEKQGKFDDASTCYEQALTLDPDYAEAHWTRALIWLRQGNLTQGWPEYEWRFRLPEAALRDVPQPRWDGSPLTDRTIRVYAEQGVGDELLFASCFPDLLARASHCVIECDPRLVPLFVRSFPTASIVGKKSHGDAVEPSWERPIDVQTAAGSLPRFLRPTLASFPTQTNYLKPDVSRLMQWRQRITALGPGLKVGIVWRSLKSRRDDPYYTRLEQWGPILTQSGLHFVNLQHDEPAAELAAASQQWGVPIHTWDDLDLFNDFDGVAALLASLDLVIAPETTIVSLAGGLGRSVWRLTHFGGSWDSLGTESYPWFPSVRVLCQPQCGDWGGVLQRVANDLAQLTHPDRSTPQAANSVEDRL